MIIYVVHDYGQYNYLITRALRDIDIKAKLISKTTKPLEVQPGCEATILGKAPDITQAGNCAEFLDLGLPAFDIFLSLCIISQHYGTEVQNGAKGGYESVSIEHDMKEKPIPKDTLFAGCPKQFTSLPSHADEVTALPSGVAQPCISPICPNETIGNASKQIYNIRGTQK